jgi:glycine/D-amino acid oxidase-like deaminating enzyme/nitrite reductase/ring-hydroxylating ferredoxin subunit
VTAPGDARHGSSDLPGEGVSLWTATAPAPERPRLQGAHAADVAVLGAGISGLLTALRLQEAGVDVAVLEAGRVGGGATGHTTAKLSSLHGLQFADLAGKHGDETAARHGAANQAGLARIAQLVEELGIDCDFRRRDNYTYAAAGDDPGPVEEEAEVARRLGLPAQFTADTPLPFPVAGAVRFTGQAEFHPRKFLNAVAERFVAAGGRLWEHSPAQSVDDGRPCEVRTPAGTLRAGHVVVATGPPVLDRGLYFARTHPERSYALAFETPGAPPEGMFLSTERPAHTIRAHDLGDRELLILGGESHKVGQGGDTAVRYRRLIAWARENFGAQSPRYRWSTQDNMPIDGLPYIGRLWPFSGRLLVATGYRKWGLAQAAVAADILGDAVLGRESQWADLYDPGRTEVLAGATDFLKENVNVALHFFADRLTRRARASTPLEPGEGRVVSVKGRQVAVSRDEDGRTHAVSARCTHLGCIVAWNSAERSWDCPCHGSRFARDGTVLMGPAVTPLAPRQLD